MITEIKAGPIVLSDSAVSTARGERSGGLATADVRGHFSEAASRNSVFTLTLNATTTGVAAGNIVAAAAAASTQFALWNPVGSGKNLELLRFGMGVISGTPGAGPVFHGVFQGVPTLTSSTGTAYSNLVGQTAASVARWMASAAGAALTGGVAPITFACSAFSSTATAQASVGELNAVENLDGSIVLPPGTGWVPLWSAAGTALLNAYTITWQETTP